MSWSVIATVGGHRVYDVEPTLVVADKDGVLLGKRRWVPPLGGLPPAGQAVQVYVSIGCLSDKWHDTVVRTADGSVELWVSLRRKTKEGTTDADEATDA